MFNFMVRVVALVKMFFGALVVALSKLPPEASATLNVKVTLSTLNSGNTSTPQAWLKRFSLSPS
jgi:hypothetical protein